jgi:hypothetical protein
MTKVDFDAEYLLDPKMVSNLRKIKQYLREDHDWVTIIHGPERGGKSTLGHECNAIVDDEYDTAHVVFPTSELRYAIAKSPKYRAIQQDEGAETWLSGDANTADTKKMVKSFMQIGAKNLYFSICLPDAGALNRYMKTHRVNCVLRVMKRGVFAFYSAKRAKTIKKDNNTKKVIWPRPNFVGYFRKIPESCEFWKEYKRKEWEHKFSTRSENPKVIEKELQMERFLRDTLDFRQAARVLGVSSNTVNVWNCNGVLKKRFHVKPMHGAKGWRLTQSDVMRMRKIIYGNAVDMITKIGAV